MKRVLYIRDFKEDVQGPVDVILSPQFYWIKPIEAKVSSLSDAKKIARHLFDFDPKNYFLDAIQIGEKYYAIAVPNDIRFPFNKKFIRSLSIAQCAFNDFECVNLPNGYSLRKINGIFFCFPGHLEECECCESLLEKIELKCRIPVPGQFILSRKQVFSLLFALLLFIVVTLAKIFQYDSVMQKFEMYKEAIAAKGYPVTTIQLESMVKEWQMKEAHLLRLKRGLQYLQHLPLNDGERLKRLQYGTEGYFEIVVKTQRDLTPFLQKHFVVEKIEKDNLYKARLREK